MVLDPEVKYAVPLTDEIVGSPRLPIMEDSTPMIEEKIPAGPLSVSLLGLASCQPSQFLVPRRSLRTLPVHH